MAPAGSIGEDLASWLGQPSRQRVGPFRTADPDDLLSGHGREEIGDGDIQAKVGAVAPRQKRGIQLRHGFQSKTALVEARVGDNQVVIGIGHAQAVEGKDVQVNHPRTPSAPLRIAAQGELQAFELDQEVGGRKIGLKLERGILKPRLIKRISRRGVVQRGHANDLADASQLRDRRAKSGGRLAEIPPKTDKGAHARTVLDASIWLVSG